MWNHGYRSSFQQIESINLKLVFQPKKKMKVIIDKRKNIVNNYYCLRELLLDSFDL